MKNYLLIISILSVTIVTSCTSSLSSRMNEYVSDVETECSNWTSEQWELSQEEYALLLKEYEENFNTYTQEEKDAINRAIGRYNGLLIKQGIQEAGSVLQDLGERLPSLIEGFMSAFDADGEQEGI